MMMRERTPKCGEKLTSPYAHRKASVQYPEKNNRVTVSTSISAHVLWGSRFHDGANEGLRVVLAPPAKFRYTGRTYAKEDLSLRESERGVVG